MRCKKKRYSTWRLYHITTIVNSNFALKCGAFFCDTNFELILKRKSFFLHVKNCNNKDFKMKFNEENSRKVANIENIESCCKETHQTVICHTVDTHMSYTCCIAVAIVTDLLLDLTSRISA